MNKNTLRQELMKKEAKKLKDSYSNGEFLPVIDIEKCQCDIRNIVIENDEHLITVLSGNNLEQLLVGWDTSCGLRVGYAADSILRDTLLNPNAGFLVIKDKDTERIIGAAVARQLGNDALLVDSFEYAHYMHQESKSIDALILKWIEQCNYADVYAPQSYDNGNISKYGLPTKIDGCTDLEEVSCIKKDGMFLKQYNYRLANTVVMEKEGTEHEIN